MKFNLKNIRLIKTGPIKDMLISFTDSNNKPLDFVVIGGSNGSGKTTILESITELLNLLTRCAHMSPNYKRNTKYSQLDLMVDDEELTIWIGDKPTDAIHSEQNVLGYERLKSGRYRRKASGDLISYLHSQTHYDEEEIDCKDFGSITHIPDNLPTIIHFPGNRVIEKLKGNNQIYKETTPYNFIYKYKNIRQFEGSFQSYLIWLEYADKKTFRRITDFINQLEFGKKKFKINRLELEVEVVLKDGTTHSLDELSSGEQNLFIILTELRRRIDRPSIVLIDKIELSLHSAFQLKLLEGLHNLQKIIPMQVIVTTHSTSVFNYLDNDARRVLNQF